MREYVALSLETHLFFGRIMKEHSLFLLAGFPAKETRFIQRADQFREEFEDFRLCRRSRKDKAASWRREGNPCVPPSQSSVEAGAGESGLDN